MPNRIIKESICTSSDIDVLSPDVEVFFYRLMVNCDDFGLLDARPAIIKAKCYPLKSIDFKQIQLMLTELNNVGLLHLYEVEGKPYLHMTGWEKHQQTRATKPKYPTPDDASAISCNQLISTETSCFSIKSASNTNTNTHLSSKKEEDSGFGSFWKSYPKKKNKADALKAWNAAKVNGDFDRIMEALEHHKALPDWTKDNGTYIPYPASWIRGRRWEDELDVSEQKSNLPRWV